MPPAEPGSASSQRYRRDHSSPVLAASTSSSPSKKAQRVPARRIQSERGALTVGRSPRIQRRTPPIHALIATATHHQAEKPNSTKATSASQAPSLPAQLCGGPLAPDVDQAASCGE